MIRYFISIFLLSGRMVLSVCGQSLSGFSIGYDTLSFMEFVRIAEKQTDAHYFFDPEQVDTILFKGIRPGVPIDTILKQGIARAGLHYARSGNSVFIFGGAPLTGKLPEYEYHAVQAAKQGPANEERGHDAYLKTMGAGRQHVITVGMKNKAVKGKKCLVTGIIRRKSNGEVLVGATLYIKELELGTISDVNGNFSFRVPPGMYTISINHMAMKQIEYGLKVLSDGMMTIELEDNLIEIGEVKVVDSRRGNVEGVLMGFEHMTARSMKEIPVVLGERDLLNVARMLPGVQDAGEEIGRAHV